MRGETKHLESKRTGPREERERWEEAREDCAPPGAFWEIVQPSPDRLSCGNHECRGIMCNVPGGDLGACMNMVEVKGVPVRRPNRRLYV